ncbi:MAG: nucleotidyltransferase family protein, partial [Candidatus Rokuibacteriota bacterium]
MLARRPDVREAWLFGSLARGDATPRSDADL